MSALRQLFFTFNGKILSTSEQQVSIHRYGENNRYSISRKSRTMVAK